MKDEIELRNSKIVSQKPLGTKNVEDEGFSDVLNADGEIEVELNRKVITERISKDLYKNAKSGLRELLMNSFRACRIARDQYNERNPHIIVKYDSPNRALTIHDINAQGISKERFKKVLLVLGNSDNLNSGETGQFGMGFASYTTLSSTILLETKYRTEDGGVSYAMLGRQGLTFKQVKREALDNYGTKLTLQLHNEITLQEVYEMEDMVKTIAKLQNIECTLVVDDDVEKITQMSLVDLIKHKISVRGDADNVEYHTGVENDIAYAIAFPSYSSNNVETFLGGAPIKMENEIEMMGGIGYFNALDEDKYKPMPERERFTKKAEAAMQEVIENIILKKIINEANLPTDIKGMFETENKQLIKRMHSSGKLQKYAPKLVDTIQTLQHINVSYTTGTSEKKKLNREDMYQLLTSLGSALFLRYTMLTKRYRAAVESEHDNIVYIKDEMHILEEIREQIPLVSDYIKDNELAMPKQESAPTAAILHSNFDGAYDTTHFESRNQERTVVMVEEGQIIDIISELKRGKSNYYFVKNYQGFEGFSISWKDYKKEVANSEHTFGGVTEKAADLVKEYDVFTLPRYMGEDDAFTSTLTKTLADNKYFYIKNNFDFKQTFVMLPIKSFGSTEFTKEATQSDLQDRFFMEYMFHARSPLEKAFVLAVSKTSYHFDRDIRKATTFPKAVSKFTLNEWNLDQMIRLIDKFQHRPEEFEDFKVPNDTGRVMAVRMKAMFHEYMKKHDNAKILNHLLTGNTATSIGVKEEHGEQMIGMGIKSGKEFSINERVTNVIGSMEIVSVYPQSNSSTLIKIRWNPLFA